MSITTDSQHNAGRYPHPYLWINGRRVPVDRIISGKERGATAFEENTFLFMKEWLSGGDRFSMMTSGSTGKPKEITLIREQMIMSATMTADKIGLRPTHTALVCIDTRYIGGKMMLVRAMTLGLPVVAIEPSANPLIKIPIDKCVQFTAFVPYQVSHILESKHPHLLNGLDKILIGGAPLSVRDQEKLMAFQCACYETYGMTETVSHIALRLVNTAGRQEEFEALPGVDISQDDRGCLVIHAKHLSEPVVTNDLVKLTKPGSFLWLGRWDNVINSGGVKIFPEKIEQQLERLFFAQGIGARFFIAALPDEKLGSKVVLIIEGVEFSSDWLRQSLEQLRTVLSPYEMPKEVYCSPTFSLTGSQKIDRNRSMTNVRILPL